MLTFLYYRSMCISIYNAKSARPVPDGEIFTLSVQRLVCSSRSLVSVSRFNMLAHSIRSSNTSLGSDNPNWDITVIVFRVRCSSSYIFYEIFNYYITTKRESSQY